MALCHIIILLGISGDLARKLVLPSLWMLHNRNLLSEDTTIVGFARSNLTIPMLQERVTPYARLDNTTKTQRKWKQFWNKKVVYVQGKHEPKDYQKLNSYLNTLETNYTTCNRIFYLALPPHVYASVAKLIADNARGSKGLNRIVLEKPFGSDFNTSKELNAQLTALFSESEIFRMDHYLGEEMVQNILPFRFANQAFEPTWNQKHIETVEILFKEPFGAYGRGAYFDKYGMIRDVVQNHLLQALILLAMEEPRSLSPEDIRDAKVNLLKQIKTLEMKNVVLGQYIGNLQRPQNDEGRLGYLDDPTVKANSTTSTYSMTILEINNTRWYNVPFVIRAGKALDEDLVEIRVYYKVRPNLYSINDFSDDPRNILVLRLRPKEEISFRLRVKSPTNEDDLIETKLDMSYEDKFNKPYVPTPYEKLILDAIHNKKESFVHAKELEEAWRIFTPALHNIDAGRKLPHPYVFGSKTLAEADALLKKLGLVYLV